MSEKKLRPWQSDGLAAIIRRALDFADDRDEICGTNEVERLQAFGLDPSAPTLAMLDHVISISGDWADTDGHPDAEDEQAFHSEAKALKRWIEEDVVEVGEEG